MGKWLNKMTRYVGKIKRNGGGRKSQKNNNIKEKNATASLRKYQQSRISSTIDFLVMYGIDKHFLTFFNSYRLKQYIHFPIVLVAEYKKLFALIRKTYFSK